MGYDEDSYGEDDEDGQEGGANYIVEDDNSAGPTDEQLFREQKKQFAAQLKKELLYGTGLHGAFPLFLAEAQSSAVCPNLDFALVNETLAALADSGRVQDIASPLLSDIKQYKPKVRIDPNTQRRMMSGGVGQPLQSESHPCAQRAPKDNGKGRDTRGYY